MFWERQSRKERIAALHEIQETLRRHHQVAAGPDAHPNGSFCVPEWDSAAVFSGAVLAGAAPDWDLERSDSHATERAPHCVG